MKRKITLSIALVMSIVLVLLTSSDSRVEAQSQLRVVADTGVVTLGPNQLLRVVAGFDPGPLDGKFIRFRKIEYTQGVCSGGVCKHTIASQNTSNPITLAAGEVASFDHIGNFNFRVMVESNRQNVKVNAMIIDTVTGEVVSVFHNDTIDKME